MSATQVISDAVNYKAIDSSPPRYRFRKIPLFNISSGEVIIAAASTQLLQFKLPADVYNLSKSQVEYDAVAPPVNSSAIWAAQDTPELVKEIRLTDGGSAPITTVQEAQNYARIQRPLNTKLNDYLGNDELEAFNPSNALATSVDAIRPNNTSADVNYLEKQYLIHGAKSGAGGANPQSLVYRRKISLDAYKDSIFAMDRDLYFGQDMYIDIQAGPATKMVFSATEPDNPLTGAAPMTTDLSITKCYLYLAVEVNPLIVASIKHKYVTSGISMMIPYPYMKRLTTTAAANTSFGLNYIVQPAMGLTLQKIIYQPQNVTESSNTFYDTYNVNGVKLIEYQTALDSQPLQDEKINCSSTVLSDWRHNKQFCHNTPILNSNVYQANFFHQDCWSGCYGSNTSLTVPHENIVAGLPLDIARTWSLDGTTGSVAVGLQHYIYVIVQRELTIHPINGIMFDIGKQNVAVPSTVVQ